ncbi:MAG TPA: hypothetical protein VMV18_13210, partial [bacterium]|nr:hypothetical protein [bacterium]
PGVVLRIQFVGLSVDEAEVLQLFVDSLESSLEAFSAQLRALQKLDLRRLRGGYEKGVRLPTLATCEQTWVNAAPGTPEADLAIIALARCRALMVCALFEAFFESGEESPPGIPPFRQWRGEMKMAGDLLRAEISRRLAGADVVGAKELKDLEARLTSAADHLDRIAERVTGQKREEKRVGRVQDAVVRSQDEIEREHIVEAAQDAAANAGAPVQMETTFLGRKDVRRWIGIIVPTLVFAAVVIVTRWQRHSYFPPATVVADKPMFKSRNVNVRTFYRNVNTGHWIAIVDATWWKGDDAERWRVTRDIAERQRIPTGEILEVRSYQGDVQALWEAGPTPPDPPPDPFPKSGAAGSAGVSSTPPS